MISGADHEVDKVMADLYRDRARAWIWLKAHIDTLRFTAAASAAAFAAIAAAAWYVGL